MSAFGQLQRLTLFSKKMYTKKIYSSPLKNMGTYAMQLKLKFFRRGYSNFLSCQSHASCTYHPKLPLCQWPSFTTQPQRCVETETPNWSKLQICKYLEWHLQDFCWMSAGTLTLPSCTSGSSGSKIMCHKSCNITHKTWNF